MEVFQEGPASCGACAEEMRVGRGYFLKTQIRIANTVDRLVALIAVGNGIAERACIFIDAYVAPTTLDPGSEKVSASTACICPCAGLVKENDVEVQLVGCRVQRGHFDELLTPSECQNCVAPAPPSGSGGVKTNALGLIGVTSRATSDEDEPANVKPGAPHSSARSVDRNSALLLPRCGYPTCVCHSSLHQIVVWRNVNGARRDGSSQKLCRTWWTGSRKVGPVVRPAVEKARRSCVRGQTKCTFSEEPERRVPTLFFVLSLAGCSPVNG